MKKTRDRRRAVVAWSTTILVTAMSGLVGAQPSSAATYVKPSASASATLRIANWGDPNDKAVYDAAIARFNVKYPNVKVVNDFTPITTWSEYINKVVADAAAGNAPDIVNVATEGVRIGASKNFFSDLSSYLANDPAGRAIRADVDPRLMSSLAIGGKQYLLPNTWNTMLIYYNTKMFADAGIARPKDNWTWADFLRIARKLTTGSGASKVYGYVMPYFNFGLTPWFYTNATSEVNPAMTKSNLTDKKMIEASQFIVNLVNKYKVAPNPKGVDPYQLFPAGKAAMTGAGHWVVGGFASAGFKDYDVLPWPRNKAAGTVYGTAGFGIYPGSQNKDLAWELMKELVGAESQKGFVKIGAATPSSRSAAASEAFLSVPAHAELYYKAIEYAKPVQAPVVFTTLEPAVMRAFDSMLAGTPVVKALTAADKQVAAAFKAAK